jgi:hypothetical protein
MCVRSREFRLDDWPATPGYNPSGESDISPSQGNSSHVGRLSELASRTSSNSNHKLTRNPDFLWLRCQQWAQREHMVQLKPVFRLFHKHTQSTWKTADEAMLFPWMKRGCRYVCTARKWAEVHTPAALAPPKEFAIPIPWTAAFLAFLLETPKRRMIMPPPHTDPLSPRLWISRILGVTGKVTLSAATVILSKQKCKKQNAWMKLRCRLHTNQWWEHIYVRDRRLQQEAKK